MVEMAKVEEFKFGHLLPVLTPLLTNFSWQTCEVFHVVKCKQVRNKCSRTDFCQAKQTDPCIECIFVAMKDLKTGKIKTSSRHENNKLNYYRVSLDSFTGSALASNRDYVLYVDDINMTPVKKSIESLKDYQKEYNTLLRTIGGENRLKEMVVIPLFEEGGKALGVLRFMNRIKNIKSERYVNFDLNVVITELLRVRAEDYEKYREEAARIQRELKIKEWDIYTPISKFHLDNKIEKLANQDMPLLLIGEKGSGKSYYAKKAHNKKYRKGPFMAINVSGLVGRKSNSVMNDLNRYIKKCNGGTIHLEEYTELPYKDQEMLLDLIEKSKAPHRNKKEKSRQKNNVRFIFSTEKNISELENLAKPGRKRILVNLLDKIKPYSLTIPPLRDQIGFLEIYVHDFIKKYNKENKRNVKGIKEDLLTLFQLYQWPGNLRELDDYIEKMFIFTSNEVKEFDTGILFKYLDETDEIWKWAGKFIRESRPKHEIRNLLEIYTENQIELMMILYHRYIQNSNCEEIAKAIGKTKEYIENRLEEIPVEINV